jgi:hypothetical protein
VYSDSTKRPGYALVQQNCAKFGRLIFGSASEMRIVHATDDHGRADWEITIRTEGHPVHEAPYVAWVHAMWAKFFKDGFGPACEVQNHARLEAGSRQDGTAPEQLIMMPSLILDEKL